MVEFGYFSLPLRRATAAAMAARVKAAPIPRVDLQPFLAGGSVTSSVGVSVGVDSAGVDSSVSPVAELAAVEM